MRSDGMSLQWERKCIVQELFVASEPFSEPFSLNFAFPVFLPQMWSDGRSESLSYLCPCEYLVELQWRGKCGNEVDIAQNDLFSSCIGGHFWLHKSYGKWKCEFCCTWN